MINQQHFQKKLHQRINHCRGNLQHSARWQLEGKLTRLIGLTLEATGVYEPIGSRCFVYHHSGKPIEAEVIGFDENKTYLMCSENTKGLASGAKIIPTGSVTEIRLSDAMLGSVLDGSGAPLNKQVTFSNCKTYPLIADPINPLSRKKITAPLDVGVQAINALLTGGRGQRMGLFAGSGVGKSVLLGMMTRNTSADVIVVGLIGERGREVKEFIEDILGEQGLARSVIVAAPADQSPLMRLHGALVATTVAEYFRDQGKNVLLIMDSLTRFAQAQREIGLAVGEPPTTKGYPPSVFAKIPQLVERAGNAETGGGSITAFYTVLTEGDDQQDPIADASRAVLDGHIVLSRKLAESGHYPAIDLEQSISRVMPNIADQHHIEIAQSFKRYYSKYQQNYDLVNIGAYKPGSDLDLDTAINLYPQFQNFLSQKIHEHAKYEDSLVALEHLFQHREVTDERSK